MNSEDSPWLHDLAQRGLYVESLISTAGFTQRSALFTGTYCDTRDQFGMFCFNPKVSPYRCLRQHPWFRPLARQPWWSQLPNVKGMWRVKDKLRERWLLRERKLRSWAEEEAHKIADYIPSIHIPLVCLPFLDSGEDRRPISEPGAQNVETVFDICKSVKAGIEYLMFPIVVGDDDKILEMALSKVETAADLYLLTFADLDRMCHVHGTGSPFATGRLEKSTGSSVSLQACLRNGLRISIG